MTMPADRERDRRSLQDLAKMAQELTPPPSGGAPSGVQRALEAKKDDSGIVDLAAASQADPSAALRAQHTPLASHGLFDDEPQSQRPPASAPMPQPAPSSALPAQPAPSIPPAPASVSPESVAAPAAVAAPADPSSPTVTEKKRRGTVVALVVGGAVALGAAAAGVMFVGSNRSAESAAPTSIAAIQPAPAEMQVQTQTEPPNANVAPEPATEESPAPEPEPSVASNALPTARGKLAMAPKLSAKGGGPAKAEPATAEGPAKMTEKDLAPAPAGAAGDLGAAMKKEVGDDAPKPAAAATGGNTSTGNVPQKPSQGAVTGALGAVLPEARACLGPDDPVSRASVMFSSAGTVQSVKVSGAAAGKPAEVCIKNALMKAKVQPFAEPSYMANITVRHN